MRTPQEDYIWWEATLGRPLPPGKFGENLTLRGIDVSGALIGERWRVGSAVVEVTSPRVPCYKLAMTMDDPAFVKQFARALRPGAYLAVIEEGTVTAGDPVEVVSQAQSYAHARRHDPYLFLRARTRVGDARSAAAALLARLG